MALILWRVGMRDGARGGGVWVVFVGVRLGWMGWGGVR